VTKTAPSDDFEEIVFVDFEFVAQSGERPDVVCVGWHVQSTGQTHRLLYNQLGSHPPYRIDKKTLFVCFVGNAELGCHLSLGWPLPANVLDLSTEFRCITNGRTVPEGRGLHGAQVYFGLTPTMDAKIKTDLQKRIGCGWPFTAQELGTILEYCATDVDAMVQLLPKMLPYIDLDVALHWGEFVRTLALMEHAGVPIDEKIYRALSDKLAWQFIRDHMVSKIDADYGVYIKGADGDWHFNMDLFEQYLDRNGINWPRTETGKLSTKGKTFENMSKGHPRLEALRQLRHTRDKMRKIKLTVGADGRNRTTLWPFKAKSSRTQPKASQWIFSPAVWLRGLIKPQEGMAIAYVDWSSMEFMIAAALSGDPMMLQFYRDGDPYLSFAKRVGTAPAIATKTTHGTLRDQYKVALLSTQYGIREEALGGRLGVSTFAAHEMLAQHRELFSTYWRWAHDWLAHALDTGVMWTPMGWECRIGITEFNERSIMNFPIQATGADILRLACVWATRRGLRLLAPVHDALLLEASLDRIEADVALLQEIMRRASRVVLNSTLFGPLELRTDVKIVRFPGRYSDPRGEAIWNDVLGLLAEFQQQTQTSIQRREGA
jgi:DNA polymerase I